MGLAIRAPQRVVVLRQIVQFVMLSEYTNLGSCLLRICLCAAHALVVRSSCG